MTSKKDQEQYWADRSRPYRYVPVPEFMAQFRRFHVGRRLENELSVPYDKSRCHRAALVFSKHSVSTSDLLKTSFAKEWLLIKRNSFVYIFKTVQVYHHQHHRSALSLSLFSLSRISSNTLPSISTQLTIMALVVSTVFLRTLMHQRSVDDGFLYIGALLFGLIVNMFNGFAELTLTISRLPVFYKHRDLLFYPAWIFTLPNVLLRIPMSIIESVIWVVITYYTIGFAPEASR